MIHLKKLKRFTLQSLLILFVLSPACRQRTQSATVKSDIGAGSAAEDLFDKSPENTEVVWNNGLDKARNYAIQKGYRGLYSEPTHQQFKEVSVGINPQELQSIMLVTGEDAVEIGQVLPATDSSIAPSDKPLQSSAMLAEGFQIMIDRYNHLDPSDTNRPVATTTLPEQNVDAWFECHLTRIEGDGDSRQISLLMRLKKIDVSSVSMDYTVLSDSVNGIPQALDEKDKNVEHGIVLKERQRAEKINNSEFVGQDAGASQIVLTKGIISYESMRFTLADASRFSCKMWPAALDLEKSHPGIYEGFN